MIDGELLAGLRMFLGEPVLQLLEDPRVSEVYCNSDLVLRSDGAGGRLAHPHVLDADRLLGFLTGIANDAGLALDREHPIRDFELPEALGQGRLHIKIPPVVAAPLFNLRKRPRVLYLLPELIALGSVRQAAAEFLTAKLAANLGILIAGPTNSGKTSFLNALLHAAVALDPKARYVVLEDVPEIVCPAADTQQCCTSEHVTLWDLARATLRSSPDRIVVGEIRGAEAIPFSTSATRDTPASLRPFMHQHPGGRSCASTAWRGGAIPTFPINSS